MLLMMMIMVAMLSHMMLILFFLGAGPLLGALLLSQFLFGLADRQCRIFPSSSSSSTSTSASSFSTGKMLLKLLFFTQLPPVKFNGGLVNNESKQFIQLFQL